jgi:Flp pilus assembly protein TadD
MKNGTIPALILAAALACVPTLAAQQQAAPGQADGPMTEGPRYGQAQNTQRQSDTPNTTQNNPQNGAQKTPANSAPPRSDDESSSNQTRIDLSPPKGESDESMEVHEWNPLRAIKDVEIGDYYAKQGNYKAAISRFREALRFKPHDAVATFKLAQALEKFKEFDEARSQYEEYLAILKDGPSAAEARKALARLKKP